MLHGTESVDEILSFFDDIWVSTKSDYYEGGPQSEITLEATRGMKR
jgi:hypothetical protein